MTKTEEIIQNNNIKLCECGCGQQIKGSYWNSKKKYWVVKRFIYGHNNRGENNPRYIGGVITSYEGYKYTRNTNHPLKNHMGYIFTHRLIYEHYLKIIFDEDVYIPKIYEIHHINGIKDDNALINLQLLTRKEHKFKHRKNISNRTCLICGSNKTWINKKNNSSFWYGNEKDGFECNRCHNKNK